MFKITYKRGKGVVTEKITYLEEDGKIFHVKNKKQIEITLDTIAINRTIKSSEVAGMVARIPVVDSVAVFTRDSELLSHWEQSIVHEFLAEMDLIAKSIIKNFF